MTLLELIRVWPQFIEHVVDNNMFGYIVNLAQTCRETRKYFHSVKAYDLLCTIYVNKNFVLLAEPTMFYQNEYEKRLFRKIYTFCNRHILHDLNINIFDAAANGYIVILDTFLAIEGKVSKNIQKRLVDIAAINGHIDVLEYFYNMAEEFAYSHNAIDYASANGYVDMLEWFYNCSWISKYPRTAPQNREIIKFKFSKHAINMALANGHVDVINWFVNHSNKAWLIERYNSEEYVYVLNLKYTVNILDIAAENNNITILDTWYKSELQLDYTSQAIDMAARNGHLDVIKWFYNASKQTRKEITFLYLAAINFAISGGHINVLEYMYNLPIVFDYDEHALIWASKNGHIDVLDWFQKKGLQMKYTEYVLDSYEDVCLWWKNSGLEFHVSEESIISAININNIHLLEKWRKYGTTFEYTEKAADKAASLNQIDTLNWLFKMTQKYNLPFVYTEKAIDKASAKGHIKVLIWFSKTCKLHNIPFKYSVDAIDNASKNGHIEILEWWKNSGYQLLFSESEIYKNNTDFGVRKKYQWWSHYYKNATK